MKIAVVGCTHGEIEKIYDVIQYLETENNVKIDLLLCCGDFQATRNLDDLSCMACPPKYRDICTFYKYYSGEKTAPILTVFIGGNHEASNYLQELPYGGWVAPNIYYLGYAGLINVGGIRIGGLSGIFHPHDYCKGRYEKPPYNSDSVRSCYHVRNLDVLRLKQVSQPVNIMLSHDWPAGIYNHGNLKQLLKVKPYFEENIRTESLGNKPTSELLDKMKPDFWFAAHLHVKFAALVVHKGDKTKSTKFLALDKCLPKRKFLQVVDIPHDLDKGLELKYDLEWLTILYLTNHLISTKRLNNYMPSSDGNERWDFTPTEEEIDLVRSKFKNNLTIPQNFVATAIPYDPNSPIKQERKTTAKLNPQTIEFCEKLGVNDPISMLLNEGGLNISNTSFSASLLDNSSFILSTDSEIDVSSSSLNISSPFKGGQLFKTPLKLPKPLNSSDISSDDCLTSTPYKKEMEGATSTPKAERSSPERGTKTKHENSSAEEIDSGSQSAKFRRRNHAIYATNDED